MIHAGIYYEPGSLKARLCVEGARELYAYCEERGVAFERAARGVAALHSPNTGVVDFVAVAESYAADVQAGRGSVHFGAAARGVTPGPGRIEIRHALGATAASAAVFCAGLQSDRLAVACGAPADPRIVPFRGAYLRLPAAAAELVRANVYPVPDPELPFLGAHLTRTLDGRVLVGPSALLSPARDAYRLATLRPRDLAETLAWPGTWRMTACHRRAAAQKLRHALSKRSFLAEAARLIPALRGVKPQRGPAGIRAQALGRDGKLVDDFVVHRSERAIHVRNAPSPAATSSLALARLIADEVATLGAV